MIDTESFDIFDITIEVLRNKAFLALVAFCLSVFCCGKNYIIPKPIFTLSFLVFLSESISRVNKEIV